MRCPEPALDLCFLDHSPDKCSDILCILFTIYIDQSIDFQSNVVNVCICTECPTKSAVIGCLVKDNNTYYVLARYTLNTPKTFERSTYKFKVYIMCT